MNIAFEPLARPRRAVAASRPTRAPLAPGLGLLIGAGASVALWAGIAGLAFHLFS